MQLQLAPASSSSLDANSSSLTVSAWWTQQAAALRTLQPNRQLQFNVCTTSAAPTTIPDSKKSSSSVQNLTLAQLTSSSKSQIRYTIWTIDVDLDTQSDVNEDEDEEFTNAAPASLTSSKKPHHPSHYTPSRTVNSAILVLPQGRESEYQFRSLSGGRSIAKQHGFHRIIFVGLLRDQVYEKGLDSVKAELTPILREFKPQAQVGAIPIVALGSDVGARREVAKVKIENNSVPSSAASSSSSSATSPPSYLLIDDVLISSTPTSYIHRRLLFSASSSLIQSEARLNVPESWITMSAKERKAKEKKKKAKGKKKAAATANASKEDGEEENEEDTADSEVVAASSTDTSSSTAIASSAPFWATPSPSASIINYSYLPCEYQHGLLSLLPLLSSSPQSLCLIGLGGGSFAMFLKQALPRVNMDVVELEEQVVKVAHRYFGFSTHTSVSSAASSSASSTSPTAGQIRCHIGDGIKFVEELAARITSSASSASAAAPASSFSQPLPSSPLDLLILDVNNTDLGEGLSFPPPIFLEESFLQQAATCISKDQGWLFLNLGCRNRRLRESILSTLLTVFTSVFLVKPDESHVNCIVACTNVKEERIGLEKWQNVEERWKKVVQESNISSVIAASSSPSTSSSSSTAHNSFQWDSDMLEECEDIIKRIKRVERDVNAIVFKRICVQQS